MAAASPGASLRLHGTIAHGHQCSGCRPLSERNDAALFSVGEGVPFQAVSDAGAALVLASSTLWRLLHARRAPRRGSRSPRQPGALGGPGAPARDGVASRRVDQVGRRAEGCDWLPGHRQRPAHRDVRPLLLDHARHLPQRARASQRAPGGPRHGAQAGTRRLPGVRTRPGTARALLTRRTLTYLWPYARVGLDKPFCCQAPADDVHDLRARRGQAARSLRRRPGLLLGQSGDRAQGRRGGPRRQAGPARALRPMAARRRCRRRLSVANGTAGLATRHVSSRNTRRPLTGIAYRNEGASRPVPHSPSPPAGCSPGRSLPPRARRLGTAARCGGAPRSMHSMLFAARPAALGSPGGSRRTAPCGEPGAGLAAAACRACRVGAHGLHLARAPRGRMAARPPPRRPPAEMCHGYAT